ncbi:hypothetical protein ARALYDRAFT_892745 [Arabidopsis lyrata subsp. lyrata]|uniref:F-box protein At3g26010-like beta-propeller domain-containing protein n=1 Tax=Arabidopsis lyrata subsp. lyrata TaxID=81972 RepID=D7KQ10_ARALL|nr:hypothetical protein ARALYDRAFT_892745 [Arabidopsis lyrata subsp. lyrata]
MKKDEESRRHIVDDDGGQKCFVNQFTCEQHMNVRFEPDSMEDCGYPVPLFHFMLPRWMESLPCPPQVEMMDTISLFSYLVLLEGNRH